MSISYDQYLDQHRKNVLKGFNWLVDNLPDFFKGVDTYAIATQILRHDNSKTSKEEYDAYKEYFYGGNRSFRVTNLRNMPLIQKKHPIKLMSSSRFSAITEVIVMS